MLSTRIFQRARIQTLETSR